MATLSAANVVQWLAAPFGGQARTALQALFGKANVDLLAAEARLSVIEPAIVNVTASTITITAALHANKTVTINAAAGCAVTLPAATGTGNKYRFFIGTTITTNTSTLTATGAHLFGNAYMASDNASNAALAFEAAGSTIVTMDGSTRGGIKGDLIELEDMAANVMFIRMTARETGSEATPFS